MHCPSVLIFKYQCKQLASICSANISLR